MFNKILLSTSVAHNSDHAARVAFRMVQDYNANLTLLHIIGIPTKGFSNLVFDIKSKTIVELSKDYIDWVKDEIKDYYSKYFKNIDSYDIVVSVGYVYREILRKAREIKPDFIIMGGSNNEMSYVKKTLGSTIHLVTKTSKYPILLVNRPAASFWGGISNIVFATSLSKESIDAFNFVLKFIKESEKELHIFSALNLGFENLSQDEIDTKIREKIKIMRNLYLPDLKKYKYKEYHFSVWEGVPYMETVKYARECYADLIIISKKHRNIGSNNSGLENDTEQIIARAGCPVLCV